MKITLPILAWKYKEQLAGVKTAETDSAPFDGDALGDSKECNHCRNRRFEGSPIDRIRDFFLRTRVYESKSLWNGSGALLRTASVTPAGVAPPRVRGRPRQLTRSSLRR